MSGLKIEKENEQLENAKERYVIVNLEDLEKFEDFDNMKVGTGRLAAEILKYYGLTPIVAFTIVTDAPTDVDSVNPVIVRNKKLFEKLDEIINKEEPASFDGVYNTEILKLLAKHKDLVLVEVFDGYDRGIAVAKIYTDSTYWSSVQNQ
jgi:hypothetical protein